jgi:HAD superfamily hydrolase (TIGR01484 family)
MYFVCNKINYLWGENIVSNRKKDTLLIMTDLDGTIWPLNSDQLKKLISTVKKIENEKNVKVIISPITGRQALYTNAVMDLLRNEFQYQGLSKDNVDNIGIGAAELGSIFTYGSKNSPGRKFLVNKSLSSASDAVRKDVESHPVFSKIFDVDPDSNINVGFFLNDRVTKYLSNKHGNSPQAKELIKAESKKYYNKLLKYINNSTDNKVNAVYSGILEVKPSSVSKAIAVNKLYNHYKKKYNVKGLIYCGDSPNDIDAINEVRHISRYTPPHETHVFLPANADSSLLKLGDSKEISDEKQIIKQAKFGDKADGIIELLENNMNTLVKNSPNITISNEVDSKKSALEDSKNDPQEILNLETLLSQMDNEVVKSAKSLKSPSFEPPQKETSSENFSPSKSSKLFNRKRSTSQTPSLESSLKRKKVSDSKDFLSKLFNKPLPSKNQPVQQVIV